MKSYLQGHNMWKIVGRSEVMSLEDATALKKWKVGAGKAIFAIRFTIEDAMLEHIRKAKTLKETWDTFKAITLGKNDKRL